MSPLTPYQQKLRQQRLAQERLARRFKLAGHVFRFARWLAAGFGGGPERERLRSDAGPIYENPSRELLVFESIDPLCADVRIFQSGTAHQVTMTREQVEKLAWRLHQWCDQWEQRGLRAEGLSLLPGGQNGDIVSPAEAALGPDFEDDSLGRAL